MHFWLGAEAGPPYRAALSKSLSTSVSSSHVHPQNKCRVGLEEHSEGGWNGRARCVWAQPYRIRLALSTV